MSLVAETIEYKGHTIEIKYDESCEESPREWDNICVFHCHHFDYNLGDKNYSRSEQDEYLEEVREAERNGDIVLPLYIYEHSGITISLGSFYGKLSQGHAEFDSGRLGFVQIPRKKMIEEFGKKIFTKKLKERALEIAENEVTELDCYLRGEVYGYVIDEDGDSCWGYIGDIKYCIEEAKGVVDYMVKNDRKEHCNEVKKWIKSKVGLNYRKSLCLA